MDKAEILKIYVEIKETNEVVSENVTVRMLLFSGYCKGEYFNGTILNGGVDTQVINTGNKGTLSARYMLEGYDSENKPCRIFIENNAETGDGAPYTNPKIFTDSKNLNWLEQEELVGRIENEEGKIVIIIERRDNGCKF